MCQRTSSIYGCIVHVLWIFWCSVKILFVSVDVYFLLLGRDPFARISSMIMKFKPHFICWMNKWELLFSCDSWKINFKRNLWKLGCKMIIFQNKLFQTSALRQKWSIKEFPKIYGRWPIKPVKENFFHVSPKVFIRWILPLIVTSYLRPRNCNFK